MRSINILGESKNRIRQKEQALQRWLVIQWLQGVVMFLFLSAVDFLHFLFDKQQFGMIFAERERERERERETHHKILRVSCSAFCEFFRKDFRPQYGVYTMLWHFLFTNQTFTCLTLQNIDAYGKIKG